MEERRGMQRKWKTNPVLSYNNNNKKNVPCSFLGAIDLKGTPYQAPSIATGFGAHLAQPILRKELETRQGEDNVTEDQAVEILKKCMKVLFYRDARSMNKVQKNTSQIPNALPPPALPSMIPDILLFLCMF